MSVIVTCTKISLKGGGGEQRFVRNSWEISII